MAGFAAALGGGSLIQRIIPNCASSAKRQESAKRTNAAPYPKTTRRKRVECHAVGMALNNGSGHSIAATMTAKTAKMVGEW